MEGTVDQVLLRKTHVNSRVLRDHSIALHKQGKVAEALAGYQAYLSARPSDADIWTNLGAAYRQLKHYQLAISGYHRALQLKPDDAGILSNLGNALKDAGRLEEAIECHRRAVNALPDNAQFRFNLAVSLRDDNRNDLAIAELDALLATQPDNPYYQWDKALNLLALNRYQEAWPYYEARWRTGELPPRKEACPRWLGEPFKNKKLLVFAEQGYGDTLMATRFLAQVKERGGHITLECKPELHRLFQTLPVDELITPQEQAKRTQQNLGYYDYSIPMMSLMGALNITPDIVPPPAQLHVPQEAKKKFAFIGQQAPNKHKTGIVWSGSLTFKGNDKRALPLEAFLPLTEDPNTQIYSLQKGPKAEDLKASQARPLIIDLAPLLEDFADTAAAIEQLDDIRMTDSSVFHLAGCLNKPAICLVRNQVYWPYKNLEKWYPEGLVEFLK